MMSLNLEQFCRMLNESNGSSFVMKNVRITSAKKTLGDWFGERRVSGLLRVEESGYQTDYVFDCLDVDMIAGEVPSGT
jgi:hypothetical protein